MIFFRIQFCILIAAVSLVYTVFPGDLRAKLFNLSIAFSEAFFALDFLDMLLAFLKFLVISDSLVDGLMTAFP